MNHSKHALIAILILFIPCSKIKAAEAWNQLLLRFEQSTHKHMPELQYRHHLESGHITNLFRYHYFHNYQGMELVAGGAYFDNKKMGSERRGHQGVVFSSSHFEHRVLMEQRDFSEKTLFHRWRWRNDYKIPIKDITLDFYDELFYTFNGQALNEFRIGLLVTKEWNDYLFNAGYSLFTVKGEKPRDVFLVSLRRDF
jgi:hypothetical protein